MDFVLGKRVRRKHARAVDNKHGTGIDSHHDIYALVKNRRVEDDNVVRFVHERLHFDGAVADDEVRVYRRATPLMSVRRDRLSVLPLADCCGFGEYLRCRDNPLTAKAEELDLLHDDCLLVIS